MAETRYPLGEDKFVRFGYDDYRYRCLCTFPHNYQISKQLSLGTVESLALLGASLCLFRNGGLQEVDYAFEDEYVIPDCVPRWIRDEIRRVLGDYPENFDEGKYDMDHLPASTTKEEYRKLLLKRFNDIKEWAEQEIKSVENGDYDDEYDWEKDSDESEEL